MIPAFAILYIAFQLLTFQIGDDINTCVETDQKVIAAMKYHGIRFMTHGKDDNHTFIRNGKTCKLFTNAFERHWREYIQNSNI